MMSPSMIKKCLNETILFANIHVMTGSESLKIGGLIVPDLSLLYQKAYPWAPRAASGRSDEPSHWMSSPSLTTSKQLKTGLRGGSVQAQNDLLYKEPVCTSRYPVAKKCVVSRWRGKDILSFFSAAEINYPMCREPFRGNRVFLCTMSQNMLVYAALEQIYQIVQKWNYGR